MPKAEWRYNAQSLDIRHRATIGVCRRLRRVGAERMLPRVTAERSHRCIASQTCLVLQCPMPRFSNTSGKRAMAALPAMHACTKIFCHTSMYMHPSFLPYMHAYASLLHASMHIHPLLHLCTHVYTPPAIYVYTHTPPPSIHAHISLLYACA